MAFSNKIKAFWKFDGNLEDEVLLNKFSTGYSFSPEYQSYRSFDFDSVSYVSKKGLILKNNEYYQADSDSFFDVSDSSYSISIGFFYNSPSVLPYVSHVITKEPYSSIVPIVSKCNTSVSSTQETCVLSESEWCITERSDLDKNYIQVQIFNNTKSLIYKSDTYIPGFHYIFITMFTDTSSTYIRVDIDGKLGTPVFIDDATYVVNMSNTISKINLNKNYIDYVDHLYSSNNRYISDLTMKKYFSHNSFESVNAIRFGASFISENDTDDTRYGFFSIPSPQPETVDTTKIFSEGSNVYVARSDGSIHKGQKPIWDNYIAFNKKEILKNLNFTNKKNNPEIQSDGIKITKNSIKL
jgi:hypothetical protein